MIRIPRPASWRPAARGAMDAVSIAGNAVLLVVFVVAALRLWGMSQTFLANAGGAPRPSLEYARLLVASEGLHLRIMWWWAAFAAAVGSAGCAAMAVRGAVWAWRTVARALVPYSSGARGT